MNKTTDKIALSIQILYALCWLTFASFRFFTSNKWIEPIIWNSRQFQQKGEKIVVWWWFNIMSSEIWKTIVLSTNELSVYGRYLAISRWTRDYLVNNCQPTNGDAMMRLLYKFMKEYFCVTYPFIHHILNVLFKNSPNDDCSW